MDYCETMCQLCGVSFAIARIRRPDEPYEAAWDYTGSGFVSPSSFTVREGACAGDEAVAGCKNVKRERRFEIGNDLEHVAGPCCMNTEGYSGWRISIEEMKGCRAIQCLLPKGHGWQPEEDDQEFELDSNYFLTGVGDGSPDESTLDILMPVRHGVEELWVSNMASNADWSIGLPFHPTCFTIFKHVSILRLGCVDVHGLWNWRQIEGRYSNFFEKFPRDPAVRRAQEQWWCHQPGYQYLAANPIEIPGFRPLLDEFRIKHGYSNVHSGAFDVKELHTKASRDVFMALPKELVYMLLDYLTAKDIANLRLASRTFQYLPMLLFRRLLHEDMPWMWEARDMAPAGTNWYELYRRVKSGWLNLKGLKNRKRIWKDIDWIVDRIKRYREQGKIRDDWTSTAACILSDDEQGGEQGTRDHEEGFEGANESEPPEDDEIEEQ